jgi:hypothetical protein
VIGFEPMRRYCRSFICCFGSSPRPR